MDDLWASVDSAESVVAPPAQEGVSLCEGCVAPCCWSMKVLSYEADTWHDLEYIYFLTCFDEIDIVLVGSRHFRLFYRAPCNYLDTKTGRYDCTLHGLDSKPFTCVEYDESDCFYRHALLGPPLDPSPVIRLDRRRWLAMAPLVQIDPDGKIEEMPSLEDVHAAIQRDAQTLPKPPGVARRPFLGELGAESLPHRLLSDRSNTCDGCAALCCQVLIFEKPVPRTIRNLEYLRYQLGFPGVSAAVTSKGWRLMVRATCRFFDTDTSQCTIHGSPDRPSLCQFYNQYLCDYRRFFAAGPDKVLRLGLDEVGVLLDRLPTDSEGHLPNDLSVGRLARELDPTV